MSWISIVFWVITNAPTMINLVGQVLSLIHTVPSGQQGAVKSAIGASMARGRGAEVGMALEAALNVLKTGSIQTEPVSVS